ncbi:hypothetical protein HGB13_00485 [bacterium]|nr:hypothetical protein [bacterium]
MSDQAATMAKLGKEFRKSAVTRYKEGKPIISDAELTSCIVGCLIHDGFGFSVDTSALEVITEVRSASDYGSDRTTRLRSIQGINWDKKYIVKDIPGFSGSIVVFASMRHVPPGHFSDKLTSREEFEKWCKDQRNLERRRKRWHASHCEPGVSYQMPKDLFGDVFSTAKPRTGVLVDTLEDTELTTADIMSIVVCYEGLDVGDIIDQFVLRKFVAEAMKRFGVRVDFRNRLCLYGSGLKNDASVFFASTTDAISTTIRNVFKAGTAVESSIKKYENDITRPITQEYE